jgi:hypothetical protein
MSVKLVSANDYGVLFTAYVEPSYFRVSFGNPMDYNMPDELADAMKKQLK